MSLLCPDLSSQEKIHDLLTVVLPSTCQGALSNIKEKQFSCMVELGDNSTYSIQGVGSNSFQLNLGDTLQMEEILYVPGLKKNLLSVSILEDKGFCVIFMENQVYLWRRTRTFILLLFSEFEKEESTRSQEILFQPWYIILSTHVSFVIGDSDIFTSEHFLVYSEW